MKLLKGKLRSLFAAFSVALVALVLAPSVALAADALQAGTATISNLGDNVTKVELFKVASISNNTSTNELEVTWNVNGVTTEQYQHNPEQVAVRIAASVTGAATYTAPDGDNTLNNGTASFKNVDAGLYLVKVTPEDAGVVYQPVIMKVAPTAKDDGTWSVPSGKIEKMKVSNNNINTSLTKKVSADNQKWADSVDTLSAGETAYFKVSVAIPYYDGLTTDSGVTFTLTDELPNGLTLVENSAKTTHGTVFVNNKTITVTMNATDLTKIKNDQQILTLTLQATVDDNQLGKLTNKAKATYYKHASDTETTSTDEKTADVIVYGAQVGKYVGKLADGKVSVENNADKLNGAIFKLEKINAEGDNKTLVADNLTANNMTNVVKSLGAGTYQWAETQAPAGYELNNTPLQFTIDKDSVTDYVSVQKFGDIKDDTVVNLPQTGGPGTIALTVAGVVVMAGAACLMIRSRKQN